MCNIETVLPEAQVSKCILSDIPIPISAMTPMIPRVWKPKWEKALPEKLTIATTEEVSTSLKIRVEIEITDTAEKKSIIALLLVQQVKLLTVTMPMSGFYQVTLISPDLVDPRCIGSCLSVPASILMVTILDPQVHSTQVILSLSFIILKHLCHHPQSFLDHISRHGQEAVSFITIHSRYQ